MKCFMVVKLILILAVIVFECSCSMHDFGGVLLNYPLRTHERVAVIPINFSMRTWQEFTVIMNPEKSYNDYTKDHVGPFSIELTSDELQGDASNVIEGARGEIADMRLFTQGVKSKLRMIMEISTSDTLISDTVSLSEFVPLGSGWSLVMFWLPYRDGAISATIRFLILEPDDELALQLTKTRLEIYCGSGSNK